MKKNYSHSILTLLITLFFSFQLSAQVNVTFKVDMSSETISADGVHIVGSINDWNTTATPLTKEGDTNIYSASIQLNTGWQEYKFLNGNAWGTDESAGYPCAASNGNRFVYINDSGADVTLVSVPFSDCNSENTGFSVTLNADMSSETVSADGVRLAGWFNGWNNESFSVPVVNGSIYSATLRLPTPSDYPITFEYKFINGADWETPLANCATVANDNRIETITSSGQNIYNVFNGCNYTLSTNTILLESVSAFYVKNQGIKIITPKNLTNLNVRIIDLAGRQIIKTDFDTSLNNQHLIAVNSIKQGIYLVQLESNGAITSKKILIN